MRIFMGILLFLLLSSFCFAQNKNITVTYGLSFQEDELLKGSDIFKVHLDYAIANPNKFLFDLKVDSRGSIFELKNKLNVEENTLSDEIALISGKYSGIIFYLKDSILEQSSLLGDKIFVKKELINSWTLLNETKLIDGYLCYKATNIYRVVNSSGIFNHPVAAWYCPKIPFPYGPIGYGNLPGLILELQVRNVVYGAKKMDFESKEVLDYGILDKIKVISEEEESKALSKLNDVED